MPSMTVRREGLRTVRQNLGFGSYMRELVRRDDFIKADARAKAFRTTRNYNWWRFWLVASPVLEALLYGAIFGLLLRTNRGVDNFVGFVIIGMTVFSTISRMLMGGIGLLEANKSMIQTFAFPRAAIVLSNSLRYIYDTFPAMVVAIVAALAFQIPFVPSWSLLLVVPLYLLTMGFCVGLMFISARLTALLPDTRVLLELFARGWMFASGIFYSVEVYADNPVVYSIFTSNPAYRFIQGFREVAMYANPMSLRDWGILLAWSLGTLTFGFFYFWRAEPRYAKAF
ncbi:teichoic acid transport system permease protein [Corynebacterium mycetoides]|uniref:Teichoic acid transport system permease protein n=1 Tax=Corynebacterium mycetoides TaxID=38302 RepID=A0A1G9NKW2_9CORY|nr:teichoic acid transport system permease protein [Corynebacterium mycetoides]